MVGIPIVAVTIGRTDTTTIVIAATAIRTLGAITTEMTVTVITTEEIVVIGEIVAALRPPEVVAVATLLTIVGAEATPGVLLVAAAQHAVAAIMMVHRLRVLPVALSLVGLNESDSRLSSVELDVTKFFRTSW